MNDQHFMLTVYSDFYKGYSIHAESDLISTRLFLTMGADTHPRLFLTELSNVEFVESIRGGKWNEYLRSLVTPDVEKDFDSVNESYPGD